MVDKGNLEVAGRGRIGKSAITESNKFVEVKISGISRFEVSEHEATENVEYKEGTTLNEETIECEGIFNYNNELIKSRNTVRALIVRKNKNRKKLLLQMLIDLMVV